MSETKKEQAGKLVYIGFRDQVELPVFGGLASWDAVKHHKIEAVERGNWIVMTIGAFRVRVPMTNVAYIREEVV
jgi:hypothetical protein